MSSNQTNTTFSLRTPSSTTRLEAKDVSRLWTSTVPIISPASLSLIAPPGIDYFIAVVTLADAITPSTDASSGSDFPLATLHCR